MSGPITDEKIVQLIKYTPIALVLLFSLVITLLEVQSANRAYDKDIQLIKDDYFNQNRKRVKEEVDRVYLYIEREYEKLLSSSSSSSSSSSKEDLQRYILNHIGQIKYGENGYIFLYDYAGVCLSHIKKNLIGVNRINLQDRNGNYVVKDVIDFARDNGSGYMSYIAPLKTISAPQFDEKISYVRTFSQWEWVIGTGFDKSALSKELESRTEDIRH